MVTDSMEMVVARYYSGQVALASLEPTAEYGWHMTAFLDCTGAGAIGHLEALGEGWGRTERWTRIHKDTGNASWEECAVWVQVSRNRLRAFVGGRELWCMPHPTRACWNWYAGYPGKSECMGSEPNLGRAKLSAMEAGL